MGNNLPTEIYDFEWEVSTSGYKWVAAEKHPDNYWLISDLREATNAACEKKKKPWVITDDISIFQPRTASGYDPLRHETNLFIKFANTSPEPEEILSFANQYGLLGGDIAVAVMRTGAFPGEGELLSSWQEEIKSMKQMWGLWSMAKDGDAEGLGRFIHWDNQDCVFYYGDPDYRPGQARKQGIPYSIIASKDDPELFKRLQPGEHVVPAKYVVQQAVNEHLKKRVSPRVLWDVQKKPVELKLFHEPNSLIGALWLQFAQAIHGEKNFYYCDQCGAAFELDARLITRKSRKFCSNACRSKAQRERIEEALRLDEEGIKPAEIAKRLGSEIKTVKNWIAQRGKN
ncbi:MAG: hypothetical protein ACYC0L_05625 [Thermoleophilia bacterium]